MEALELKPIRSERMSPEEFVDAFQSAVLRSKIKDVKIVPPRIGSDGFGQIEVEFKSPSYEVDFDA